MTDTTRTSTSVAHPGGTVSALSPTVTPARDYGVLRWLVLATFIVILNETIMVNAIPRLMNEFEVSARAAQWLSTAFMLTLAVVIPVTGWFLQRVTTRQAFATAMVVFCSGTLLAAVAPSFVVLLGARVVQASGTAVMMPLLMTTLMTVVAEEDRGRIMGNVTLAMSVAPALGPAVSGIILNFASWRWMFGLVLPAAVAITVVSLRRLPNVGEPQAGSVDWFSVMLSGLGFGPLVYGLSEIGGNASSVVVAGSIIFGVAMVGVFVGRQLLLQRDNRPLLDLRTLLVPTYAKGLALMAVAFMAFLGSMILLPMYLQEVRGLSELQTGLLVAPGGLAMGLLGPRVGRIYDGYGGRPLMVPGAVLVLVGLALFTRVQVDTSIWFVLGAHVLLMIGLAMIFTPVFTLSLGALPPHLYSHGSSVLGALQQVAAAMGTAICITVLSSRSAHLRDIGLDANHALAGGMRAAFLVGAVLAVVVLALTFLMPGRIPGSAGTHGGPVPEPEPELEAA
jgi:MFS transporter, DHA2 family, lincomycin resistance protein